MAIEKVHIDQFLELSQQFPVLDVRSPGEYIHAHMPGAYNLPLFSDEERKIVGTAYKKQNRETAIKIGLDFFGPRMRSIIEFTESLISNLPAGTSVTNSPSGKPGSRIVLIHCWRGGMRSAAIAWLLDLYGFKVYTLIGGYKKYRHWVIETFSLPFSFTILGGYTGSGKTYVLDELAKNGIAVINLEKLANHKGSAFGNIGMPEQPTQEMFENLLAKELRTVSCKSVADNIDPSDLPGHQIIKPVTINGIATNQENRIETITNHTPQTIHSIWLEDESQRIGHINIPQSLWNTMRQSPVFFLNIPFEERLKHIVKEYGSLNKERMADAIERIEKRLGGLETKTALQQLAEGNIESCFRILLKYYDKWYGKGLNNRDKLAALLTNIDCSSVDAQQNAHTIIIKVII